MATRKEQYALFEEVKGELRQFSGKALVAIAEDAGVSISTLYFWIDGTTGCPRLSTMIKVCGALGMDLVLVKKTGKKK